MTNKNKLTTIEVEDITVEKAIKKALAELNVEKQEVEIKVVKEEHRGLFGMEGKQLAKIKVTLKER